MTTAENAPLTLNFAIQLAGGEVTLNFAIQLPDGEVIPADRAVSLLTAATRLVSEAAQCVQRLPRSPVSMLLTIVSKGEPGMPLTIDSKNGVALFGFGDRVGDQVAPPAGAVVTVVSSDTGVLTVGPAVPGTDPVTGVPNFSFALTEVTAGTSTLTPTATDANGNPLLEADGVTEIPAAAPVVVTVNPGAAQEEIFTVPANN